MVSFIPFALLVASTLSSALCAFELNGTFATRLGAEELGKTTSPIAWSGLKDSGSGNSSLEDQVANLEVYDVDPVDPHSSDKLLKIDGDASLEFDVTSDGSRTYEIIMWARLDCSDSTTEDISLSDEEGSVLFSPIKLACDWPTGSHKMRTEKALDVPLSLTLGFGSTDVFLYFLEFRPIVVHKEENGRIDIPATQYKSVAFLGDVTRNKGNDTRYGGVLDIFRGMGPNGESALHIPSNLFKATYSINVQHAGFYSATIEYLVEGNDDQDTGRCDALLFAPNSGQMLYSLYATHQYSKWIKRSYVFRKEVPTGDDELGIFRALDNINFFVTSFEMDLYTPKNVLPSLIEAENNYEAMWPNDYGANKGIQTPATGFVGNALGFSDSDLDVVAGSEYGLALCQRAVRLSTNAWVRYELQVPEETSASAYVLEVRFRAADAETPVAISVENQVTYSEAGRIQEFACNPLETSSREAIIEDGYQIEGVGVEFMQYCAPVKSSFVEKKGLQNLILTANATVLVDYIWVREKEGGEGEDWPSCPSLDIPRENEECSFDGVTKSPVSVSASNDGKVAASAFVQSDGKKLDSSALPDLEDNGDGALVLDNGQEATYDLNLSEVSPVNFLAVHASAAVCAASCDSIQEIEILSPVGAGSFAQVSDWPARIIERNETSTARPSSWMWVEVPVSLALYSGRSRLVLRSKGGSALVHSFQLRHEPSAQHMPVAIQQSREGSTGSTSAEGATIFGSDFGMSGTAQIALSVIILLVGASVIALGAICLTQRLVKRHGQASAVAEAADMSDESPSQDDGAGDEEAGEIPLVPTSPRTEGDEEIQARATTS